MIEFPETTLLHTSSTFSPKLTQTHPSIDLSYVTNPGIFKGTLNLKPDVSKATKFDEGKLNWSLLPIAGVEEILKVLEFGAKKYNEPGNGPSTWNWAKGTGLGKWRTISAIMRHLTSYMSGQTLDPESGLNHLAHAGCGILFLLHYHKHPQKYGNLEQD